MLNLIIVHFFGLLSPGPDFFYVSRKAASASRRASVAAVLGICAGVFVWATASLLGLSLLFATMPALQGAITILGGTYLIYLGIKMLQVRSNAVFDETRQKQEGSFRKEFMQGLMINLSNAKVVIYFASVMSFVLVRMTQSWQMYCALGIILVETFCYFYFVSLLFSRPLAKRFYSQYSRYIDNAAGAIFFCFGSYLLYQGILGLAIFQKLF